MLRRQNISEEKRADLENRLVGPEVPVEVEHLWSIFLRLTRRRQPADGVSPLSWTEMDAFLRRMRLELSVWELELLEELDDLYVSKQRSLIREQIAQRRGRMEN